METPSSCRGPPGGGSGPSREREGGFPPVSCLPPHPLPAPCVVSGAAPGSHSSRGQPAGLRGPWSAQACGGSRGVPQALTWLSPHHPAPSLTPPGPV